MVKIKEVSAQPVKSFFVHMLTRDIELTDAILDLLDNCVDGAIRSSKSKSKDAPYKGRKAEIVFDKDTFEISDNCGGIPTSLLRYALRMGRPADKRADKGKLTVGVYGIGMKRAMFKLGSNIILSTQNNNDQHELEIDAEWLKNEDSWQLPVKLAQKDMKEDGTTIVVSDLHGQIRSKFGADLLSFQKELTDKISSHYAFIIEKGFEIYINKEKVKSRPIKLVFDDSKNTGIKPFVFKASIDEVKVFLSIGLTKPPPSDDELQEEQKSGNRYSAESSGWTIICNDRVVLYADKTILSGWGEAGVPRFHNQYNAISGVVEFTSTRPESLPMTTTKRGIDAGSQTYLGVKNKMREGAKLFTYYTHKWKDDIEKSKKQIMASSVFSISELKLKESKLKFTKVRSIGKGQQFKPKLQIPKIDNRSRKIQYVRELEEIRKISSFLYDHSDMKPSEVGEACFDLILRDAKS